jgi:hypothetical protein
MYKVFDTILGQYQDAISIDEAKYLYQQLINKFVSSVNVPKEIPADIQIWNTQQEAANTFYEAFFGIKQEGTYAYSNFHLQTGQVINRCFIYSTNVLIKVRVADNSILEIYQLKSDEPNQLSVTYDLSTKEPVFKYFIDGNVFIKKDATTGVELARTFIGQPTEEFTVLLQSYPDVANKVAQYGVKDYGYVVEFCEDIQTIPNPNYEQHIADIRNEAMNRNNVIFEAPNDAGLITTQVVDTSEW